MLLCYVESNNNILHYLFLISTKEIKTSNLLIHLVSVSRTVLKELHRIYMISRIPKLHDMMPSKSSFNLRK